MVKSMKLKKKIEVVLDENHLHGSREREEEATTNVDFFGSLTATFSELGTELGLIAATSSSSSTEEEEQGEGAKECPSAPSSPMTTKFASSPQLTPAPRSPSRVDWLGTKSDKTPASSVAEEAVDEEFQFDYGDQHMTPPRKQKAATSTKKKSRSDDPTRTPTRKAMFDEDGDQEQVEVDISGGVTMTKDGLSSRHDDRRRWTKRSKIALLCAILVLIVGMVVAFVVGFANKNQGTGLTTTSSAENMIKPGQKPKPDDHVCVEWEISDLNENSLELTLLGLTRPATPPEQAAIERSVIESYNYVSDLCQDEYERWMFAAQIVDQTFVPPAYHGALTPHHLGYVIMKLTVDISCYDCSEEEEFASIYPNGGGRRRHLTRRKDKLSRLGGLSSSSSSSFTRRLELPTPTDTDVSSGPPRATLINSREIIKMIDMNLRQLSYDSAIEREFYAVKQATVRSSTGLYTDPIPYQDTGTSSSSSSSSKGKGESSSSKGEGECGKGKGKGKGTSSRTGSTGSTTSSESSKGSSKGKGSSEGSSKGKGSSEGSSKGKGSSEGSSKGKGSSKGSICTDEPTPSPLDPGETRPPTRTPTRSPTAPPTNPGDTPSPTVPPTKTPTVSPTVPPTRTPTAPPTNPGDTLPPTVPPTRTPTLSPTPGTNSPTKFPTSPPTMSPTLAGTCPVADGPAIPVFPPGQCPMGRIVNGKNCDSAGLNPKCCSCCCQSQGEGKGEELKCVATGVGNCDFTNPPTAAPTLAPTAPPTNPGDTRSPTVPPTVPPPTVSPTRFPTAPPTEMCMVISEVDEGGPPAKSDCDKQAEILGDDARLAVGKTCRDNFSCCSCNCKQDGMFTKCQDPVGAGVVEIPDG